MTGRLVVVSNRIPTEAVPSGGLVVALHDALSEQGGLWIGAHPETGDPDAPFEEIGGAPYRRLAFRLSEADYENYYLGFANSVLWPLSHHRVDLVEINAAYTAAYLAVNRRLARRMAAILKPDDLVWIHDYHFLPLAAELRALGVGNRIGFFLHIPVPNITDLEVLPHPPDYAAWLAQYDLVGLQTRTDVARCLEIYRADPRAEFLPSCAVKFEDRVTRVQSFPIGIDVAAFRADALSAGSKGDGMEARANYVIGVDRLDYSKGLPNRFRAFERYLQDHGCGDRLSLVQIAPPTREAVDAYRRITADLEYIAGQVNGLYGAFDWSPIRFIHRPVPRDEIARLLRGAKACLVPSLADGMNLVAKEFVAAQDPDDPGVLILSRFAGAAEDMTDALLVNPYDHDAVAQAIHRAFHMSRDERLRRHAALTEVVERTDVRAWSRSFIDRLSRLEPGLLLRGRPLREALARFDRPSPPRALRLSTKPT